MILGKYINLSSLVAMWVTIGVAGYRIREFGQQPAQEAKEGVACSPVPKFSTNTARHPRVDMQGFI